VANVARCFAEATAFVGNFAGVGAIGAAFVDNATLRLSNTWRCVTNATAFLGNATAFLGNATAFVGNSTA
jgi:hypothetical protein